MAAGPALARPLPPCPARDRSGLRRVGATVGTAVPLPVSALAIAWLSTTPIPWGGVVIAGVLAALGGLAGWIWAARTVRPDGRIAPSGVIGWAITVPLLGLPAIVGVWIATVIWDVANRLPAGQDAGLDVDVNVLAVGAAWVVVVYLAGVALPALLVTAPLAAIWARATRRRARTPACRMSPSATVRPGGDTLGRFDRA